MADQLALEVDPACVLHIVERRGGEERALRVGPLAEPEARALAGFLLNRTEEPPADGPGDAPSRAGCERCRSTPRLAVAAHRPRRGAALGQQLGGDAVLLGLGRGGGIAGAAHPAPGGAVELVLAAVACRRRTPRSGRRPTRTARCAAACRRRRRGRRGRSLAARRRRAVLTPSAARVRGPATPSGVRPWARWKRLTARAGLRAEDAVGADAERLLQRAHGVGALHAGRRGRGGVLGHRAAGGDGRQHDAPA